MLVGSYPLKKPDVGHLHGGPLSAMHSQFASRPSRSKQSLKPPRSLGSRTPLDCTPLSNTLADSGNALSGWKGVVATEEETGGFGWKPGDLNALNTTPGASPVFNSSPGIDQRALLEP